MLERKKSSAIVSGTANQIIQLHGDIINYGAELGEVKLLMQELIERNMPQLVAVAKEAAQTRIDDFNQSLIQKMYSVTPDSIKSFDDPGMQLALLNAQKAYAKSADSKSKALLIDLMVQRSLTVEYNLEQVSIDEAVIAAGRITKEQMQIIALIYALMHQNPDLKSFQKLCDFFRIFKDQVMSEFIPDRRLFDQHIAHLHYAGCVIWEYAHESLYPYHMMNNYGLLFAFNEKSNVDVVAAIFGDGYSLVTKLRESLETQEKFVDVQSLVLFCENNGMPIHDIKRMRDRISDANIDFQLDRMNFKEPFQYYAELASKFALRHVLSSVGMVIARSYIHLMIPDYTRLFETT